MRGSTTTSSAGERRRADSQPTLFASPQHPRKASQGQRRTAERSCLDGLRGGVLRRTLKTSLHKGQQVFGADRHQCAVVSEQTLLFRKLEIQYCRSSIRCIDNHAYVKGGNWVAGPFLSDRFVAKTMHKIAIDL